MDPDIDKLICSLNLPIEKCILEPYEYLVSIPSNNKSVRTKFLHAFNNLYYHIEHIEILDKIGEIVSIFHNSSLLIDDIEDSSGFRRGEPTAHTKYGVPLTINCGNMMYFIAMQKAQSELPNIYMEMTGDNDTTKGMVLKYEILQILIDEMLNLHHGQGLDLYWRDYLLQIKDKLPTIEEYLQMIKDKTGGLFRLSIKLLDLFSNEADKSSMLSIANLLGIIYQIRDDYLNLTDARYSNMKGVVGEDLIEGKLSLPILHCLHVTDNSPVHLLLFNYRTCEERANQHELLQAAIQYMDSTSHSLSYSKDLLKKYEAIVLNKIHEDPSFEMNNLLQLIQLIEMLCNI